MNEIGKKDRVTLRVDLGSAFEGGRYGDEESWRIIYTIFRPKVMALARQWGFPSDDAEDIVQETFLRLASNFQKLDSQYALSSYICRVAQSICIDLIRYNRAEKRGDGARIASVDDLRERGWDPIAPPAEQAGLSSEERDLYELALECVAELGPVDRDLIERRLLRGEGLAEIAKSMRIRRGALSTRLHRAMEKVRASVGKRMCEDKR